MADITGVVINGRVELDEALPDGTAVRVRALKRPALKLDAKSVRELAASARSLDRGQGIPAEKVLKRLARRRTS